MALVEDSFSKADGILTGEFNLDEARQNDYSRPYRLEASPIWLLGINLAIRNGTCALLADNPGIGF